MGTTHQADIPDNVHYHSEAFASLASNGTDRVVPFLGGYGHKLEVLSAQFVPHSSQAGSATNYAGIRVVEIDSAASVIRTLASYELSATAQGKATNIPGDFSLAATVSKASENFFAISHEQVANGIDLVAHSVHLAYRYK